MHMERERRTYVQSREAVESRIEELIALLDELDDDPDLEDGGDAEPDEDGEATLGWLNTGSQLHLHADYQDGEAEPDADGEPSLGSPERQPSGWGPYGLNKDRRSSQVAWAAGSRSDREADAGDEGEVEEPDGNGEFQGGDRLGAALELGLSRVECWTALT